MEVRRFLPFVLVVLALVGGILFLAYTQTTTEEKVVSGKVINVDYTKREIELDNGEVVLIAGRYYEPHTGLYFYPGSEEIFDLLKGKFVRIKCYMTEYGIIMILLVLVHFWLNYRMYKNEAKIYFS
jgi:hypothetical protein